MRLLLIEVGYEVVQDRRQVLLVERDEMVEALAA
jgi:hypothetical protein